MANLLTLSLYQIQVFLQAAEAGSFTTAAAQLHTTQSAVSKSIAATETILGFALFTRRRSALELTASGRYLYGQWRELLRNMDASVDQGRLLAREDQRSLVVGLPDSLDSAAWGELDRVPRFQKLHPYLPVERRSMPEGHLIPRLATGELDLIVTGLYQRESLTRLGFAWRNIATVSNIAILHRDDPLARRESLALEDLRQEEFLMLSPVEYPAYFERVYTLCAAQGFQPRISPLMPSFQAMIDALLRERKGVLISSRFISAVNRPELRAFDLGTYTGLVIAWRRDDPSRYLPELIEMYPSVPFE